MAGKLSPEKAFRLINPSGSKDTAEQPNPSQTFDEPGEQHATEPRAWQRYLLLSFISLISLTIVGAMLYGVSLLLDKQPPALVIAAEEEKFFPLTEDQAKLHARKTMAGFLSCTNTEERLRFVMYPDESRKALEDYYQNRHHFDSPLWKIQHLESAQYDGQALWMIAYRSVNNQVSHAVLEQSEAELKIHWQASYAYGELSWENFILKQPEQAVQMRAYVTPHRGPLPPDVSEDAYIAVTVESKEGEFTGLALMKKKSAGASLISAIPADARVPVNLMLHYQKQGSGIKQLSIHSLLHFQWIRPPLGEMGTPYELQR